MDENSAVYNDKKKSKVLKSIAQSLIDAYGNGKISYFEMKKAATYILDHFDDIKTRNDLVFFLENLSSYWQVFKNILILEKEDITENKEKEVIQKLSQYIKSSVNK